MEQSVSVSFAWLAGLISFFSPCVFPLIPAYVTHLTGGMIEHDRLVIDRRVLLFRSLAFIVGFSIVFVMLGAAASYVGQFLRAHRELFMQLSGILIVIFGFQTIGWLQMSWLAREKRFDMSRIQNRRWFSSLLLGMAFAAGWTPCVGLALSSILLLAGNVATVNTGIFLLAVYSLGLGVPFLLISFVMLYSVQAIRRLNRWMPVIKHVSGWLLIGMGILIYIGQLQQISAWLTSMGLFPGI
ncbi:cytochrome c biogenesis protein CcdA [Aneurinibacillus soli]|uniref:Thiol:disulfide interchange protein n=1 Tax=Aneurinibacillus soli TaxID=1500254 RepID=A0A0U5BFY9_9BACL|nr:cytochrome c biogenesis CcdA family protein [Aneurinibacillus soli]PYE58038.1 cytochrome c biogenesis protein CcdA [Aneurinibacillus soli]BAU29916.1 thiol:disulfide interchange protein precursor [Aneurinibacillus soli]